MAGTATPPADGDVKLADNRRIPDLALDRPDLTAMIAGHLVGEVRLVSANEYGGEHIFYLEKRG